MIPQSELVHELRPELQGLLGLSHSVGSMHTAHIKSPTIWVLLWPDTLVMLFT